MAGDLRVLGFLVGVGDAGKVLDLPGKCFSVHPFHVPLGAHLHRALDVDLDELADLSARLGSPLPVGGDKRAEDRYAVAGEQFRHERHPLDILVPVLLAEPQVAGQALAHDVAVQPLYLEALVAQFLLDQFRDGGLARPREAGEPQSETFLITQCSTTPFLGF